MSKAWFAPKRYGYGAGLPISWEGWTALLVFLAAVMAVSGVSLALLPTGWAIVATAGGTFVLALLFVVITRAKTEGGWRWRNGP